MSTITPPSLVRPGPDTWCEKQSFIGYSPGSRNKYTRRWMDHIGSRPIDDGKPRGAGLDIHTVKHVRSFLDVTEREKWPWLSDVDSGQSSIAPGVQFKEATPKQHLRQHEDAERHEPTKPDELRDDRASCVTSSHGYFESRGLARKDFQAFAAQTYSGYSSLPREKEAAPRYQSLVGEEPLGVADTDKMAENGDGEVATIYSEDKSQTSVSRSQRYISEFGDHIFGKIKHQIENYDAAKLEDCLPELLKAFALKVGQCSSSTRHLEIMYFVHKHRRFWLSSPLFQSSLLTHELPGPLPCPSKIGSKRTRPMDMRILSIGEPTR